MGLWKRLRGAKRTNTLSRTSTLKVEVLEGRQLPSGTPFGAMLRGGFGFPMGFARHQEFGGVWGNGWQRSSGSWSENDSNLSVTGTSVTATAGEEFSGVVATFTATDAAAIENYTATIKWGDGTISEGVITANDAGGFDVSGAHTYARDGANWHGFPFSGFWEQQDADTNQAYVIGVTVRDTASQTKAKGRSVADVSPAPDYLTATGENIQVTSGEEFSGVVATFADDEINASTDAYKAIISWGDGTVSEGTITANDAGGFDVAGTHTYSDAADFLEGGFGFGFPHHGPWFGFGSFLNQQDYFKIRVTILDTETQERVTTKSLATWAGETSDLSAASDTIQATAGEKFSGVISTVTDASDTATASDFTATIDWGDGSTSDGTITANDSGAFDVSGSHIYAETGGFHGLFGHGLGSGTRSYVISVTIEDTVDDLTTESLTLAEVSKAAPEIVASAPAIVATVETEYTGAIASFTDADSDGTVEGYTATIYWGDGTNSEGAVVANANGGFDVDASHIYEGTGTYRVIVKISESDGDVGISRGVAVVNKAPVSVVHDGSDTTDDSSSSTDSGDTSTSDDATSDDSSSTGTDDDWVVTDDVVDGTIIS